jgi:hypothetical protein
MITSMSFHYKRNLAELIDYALVMHMKAGGVHHLIASHGESYPMIKALMASTSAFSGWKLFTEPEEAAIFVRKLKPPKPDAK